jgi:hypothetical protein
MANKSLDELEWTAIPDEVSIGFRAASVVSLEGARGRAQKVLGVLVPPSVRMARWPNALGDTPQDAIGKTVKMSMGDKDAGLFVVDHIAGDNLMLVPE